MKIYNGDAIIEKGRVKKVDIKDLREEARDEGMTGISTRFISQLLIYSNWNCSFSYGIS